MKFEQPLFLVEVGNSSTKFLFCEEEGKWGEIKRIPLPPDFLSHAENDMYYEAKEFLESWGCGRKAVLVLTSVVHGGEDLWKRVSLQLLGKPPVVISPSTVPAIYKLHYRGGELGADRFCNVGGLAGYYPLPAISVDVGTAIHFEVVNENKEFIGGAIFPGVTGLLDGLRSRTSFFSSLDSISGFVFSKPESILGQGSYESVQSGIYYGLASLVEGMLKRFVKHLGWDSPSVVFTGGLGRRVMEECEVKGVYDPHLTFKGMVNYYKHLLKVFS